MTNEFNAYNIKQIFDKLILLINEPTCVISQIVTKINGGNNVFDVKTVQDNAGRISTRKVSRFMPIHDKNRICAYSRRYTIGDCNIFLSVKRNIARTTFRNNHNIYQSEFTNTYDIGLTVQDAHMAKVYALAKLANFIDIEGFTRITHDQTDSLENFIISNVKSKLSDVTVMDALVNTWQTRINTLRTVYNALTNYH